MSLSASLKEILLNEIPQPFFVVNQNFEVLHENRAVESLLNLSKKKENIPCYERFYQRGTVCPFCPYLKNPPRVTEKSHSVTLSIGHKDLYLEVFHHLTPENFLIEYLRDNSRQILKEIEFKRNERLIALGLVAKMVAHELENPLLGIHLTAQSLTQSIKNPEEFQRKIELIERDLQRALLIVSDIRNFQENPIMQKKPIKLKKLLEEVTIGMRRLAPLNLANQTEFRFFWNGNEQVCLYGNELRLYQVFANLIKNSFEAYSIKQKTLKKLIFRIFVFKRAIKEDFLYSPLFNQEVIEVRIIDNAGGIPFHVLKRVFDPFFTTKRKKIKGSGLGLLVVQKILEEHEAEIDLESKGHYTVVKLFFKNYPFSENHD